MVRRGAIAAVVVLLLAATASFNRVPRAPVIAAPTVALAAESDRRDYPRPGPRVIGSGLPTPVPRVVLGASTTIKLVALTFDLDMNAQMAAAARAGTVWINRDALDFLESQKIHATLFMTGMWAEAYPTLARQLATNPIFEIGDHSYSHPAFHTPCYRLGGVSRAEQARQIQLAQQAIERSTGVTPKYFRFPGGCYDRTALDLVHAAGLIPVQWDVNSIDAFNTHPQQIVSTVLSEVKPGSIVVMHLHGRANAPATGLALHMLVPELQRRGYQFVTVGQLLAAGTPIQPSDPREVSEFYQPPSPVQVYQPPLPVKPSPRWCGWVNGPHGRVYVCR
ncbi:MAG: polysaccharide deacetylase family protein [Candidatus Dormibacteraeota bacterium]|nr:polysaccharide deacetylase family protein [Candidatus Dormibacteraeota bacterium]